MAAVDRADIYAVRGSGEACSARDRCFPNSAGKLSVGGGGGVSGGVEVEEGGGGAERQSDRGRLEAGRAAEMAAGMR